MTSMFQAGRDPRDTESAHANPLPEDRSLAELSHPSQPATTDADIAARVDKLTPTEVEAFTSLGAFPPEPAVFDMPAFVAVTDLPAEQAPAVANKLITLGLLGRVDERLFQVSPEVASYATRLLEAES